MSDDNLTPQEGAGQAGAPSGGGRARDESHPGHGAQGARGYDASSEPGGADEFDLARSGGKAGSDQPAADQPADQSAGSDQPAADQPDVQVPDDISGIDEAEDAMAASYLADLQRLQAEYVNYKKRVERDRELIRASAIGSVVESLLPVLDDIHAARQAGALQEGTPFASIAGKLSGVLAKHGVEEVGEAGQEFDPTIHEALMHVQADLPEGATGTTVVQVLMPGFRIGERLVRPAKVSVADPS